MNSLLIGRSSHLGDLRRCCALYGPRRRNVVLVGERGTGKSLVAAELHRLSLRAGRPLVRIAAGELTESNIQDVMAGHVKGGFTDAIAERRGLLLAAAGGFMFLDDLQELPPGRCQSYMLEVAEGRPLRAVGTDRTFIPEVRWVFGTQRPLSQLVEEGLKPDLADRMSGLELRLLPLREHCEDILDLTPHLLERIGQIEQLTALPAAGNVLDALLSYPWPGNVRELDEVLALGLIEASVEQAPAIELRHLPARVIEGTPFARLVGSISREHVLAALESSNWVVTRTAGKLQRDRRTIHRMIREFGIAKPARGVRHQP